MKQGIELQGFKVSNARENEIVGDQTGGLGTGRGGGLEGVGSAQSILSPITTCKRSDVEIGRYPTEIRIEN